MSFLKGLGGPMAGAAGGAITPLSGIGQVGGPMSGISLFGNAMNGIAAAEGATPGYAATQQPVDNHLQLLDPAVLHAIYAKFGGQPQMGGSGIGGQYR